MDAILARVAGADAVDVGDEAREAADAVAAHLRLGAVRVVDAHGEVGVADGRQRKDDAVAADAKVAVAQLDGLVGRHDRLGGVAVVDLLFFLFVVEGESERCWDGDPAHTIE